MSSAAHQPLSGAYLLQGVRRALSLAGLILCLASFGFGAFARDLGFTLWQTAVLAGLVWALPSAVIFASAAAAGATLWAAGIAVAISAVRLLPMTVAILPQMRAERARHVWFWLASHFVAVTGYVEALLAFPRIAPERRLSFFLGLVLTLNVTATLAAVAGHIAASRLPAPVAMALAFITPIYFALSIVSASRTLTDRAALALGLALGPVAHWLEPELDLLWAGLIGGTAAFLIGRLGAAR
jgi:predicted branched-subunit amino acid permease